jgi:HAD superfamily hydrolase (TIGR01509 family)
MLNGISLIIYDLDGVLIDSSDAICISFNNALEIVGEPPCDNKIIRGMIGVPLKEMYRKVLSDEKRYHIDECFNQYKEVFLDISTAHTKILEDVVITLSHFEREGIQQCLATNKSSPEAEKLLSHFRIDKYFDLIVGSDDVSSPKPNPEIILLILDAMGVKPDEVVLVEDSPTGILTGKRAGVYTIAVTTGYCKVKTLADLEPDYLIEKLRDLLEIIFV